MEKSSGASMLITVLSSLVWSLVVCYVVYSFGLGININSASGKTLITALILFGSLGGVVGHTKRRNGPLICNISDGVVGGFIGCVFINSITNIPALSATMGSLGAGFLFACLAPRGYAPGEARRFFEINQEDSYRMRIMLATLVLLTFFGLNYRWDVEASKLDNCLLKSAIMRDTTITITDPSPIWNRLERFGGFETSSGKIIPLRRLKKIYVHPEPNALDSETGDYKNKKFYFVIPDGSVSLGIYRVWAKTKIPLPAK